MKKLLVVEDEALVAMSLSRALPRLGYEVCRVLASGEEALARFDMDQPDLILMDIHLNGGWDGIQTAEHIRARSNIPIVFMTGYDVRDIEERTQHLSNVAHVEKPVGIQTLIQIIEATLATAAV
jgi:CheY-like chemotaxis protein